MAQPVGSFPVERCFPLTSFYRRRTVLKKVVPVLGLILLAGPVLAADAPSSGPAASAASDSKPAHKKHHKKKAKKAAESSAPASK